MPTGEKIIINVKIEEGVITDIIKIDPISRIILGHDNSIVIFPAKHFITDKDLVKRAIKSIKMELKERLAVFKKEGKPLEAERIERRTNFDLEMIKEFGYCSGIENYSRHFSGANPGDPPDTLLSYFPHKKDGSPDFLTVIDESHVSVPQIAGMFAGDASRKKTLIDYGFRLPSALDNRPLKFEEFEKRVGQVVYTSATPGDYERENSSRVVEQIIRPTGLIDPEVIIRPVSEGKAYKGQVADLLSEIDHDVKDGGRVLVTTLTKRMAEDMSDYLKEKKIKACYLHSEVKTIERIKILSDFRRGVYDCLVGVNLLREGLDLPEVTFIGILDADKEGFLRSETSLIQTIGRAARNVKGRVVLYADHITGSIKSAVDETNRRRIIQVKYNKKHNITPKTIIKNINDITEQLDSAHQKAVVELTALDKKLFIGDKRKLIREKNHQMSEAVKNLDFETAAILRDEIKLIKGE
jgi:excinuclease ABC subunit B